jgi:hypothetical protein
MAAFEANSGTDHHSASLRLFQIPFYYLGQLLERLSLSFSWSTGGVDQMFANVTFKDLGHQPIDGTTACRDLL